MHNVGDKKSSTGRNQQPAAFPVIPGYRFLQTIARSPKSEIHVAHSLELGHNVAIKVLRTGPLSESPAGEEERFERERDLLMRLKHPSDRRRLRLGPRRGLPLHRHRILPERQPRAAHPQPDDGEGQRRHLPADRRRAGGRAQRRAVPPRPEAGERDDAPDGRIVLIDFGLAKRAGHAALTNAGEVRGSPYYISPEQAEGAPVDQRSDLYSLGVMFYEMLTGQRPFRGSTMIAIIQSHRNDPIPVLPPELSTLPAPARCAAGERSARPLSERGHGDRRAGEDESVERSSRQDARCARRSGFVHLGPDSTSGDSIAAVIRMPLDDTHRPIQRLRHHHSRQRMRQRQR